MDYLREKLRNWLKDDRSGEIPLTADLLWLGDVIDEVARVNEAPRRTGRCASVPAGPEVAHAGPGQRR